MQNNGGSGWPRQKLYLKNNLKAKRLKRQSACLANTRPSSNSSTTKNKIKKK
jgi:hypothetical protein